MNDIIINSDICVVILNQILEALDEQRPKILADIDKMRNPVEIILNIVPECRKIVENAALDSILDHIEEWQESSKKKLLSPSKVDIVDLMAVFKRYSTFNTEILGLTKLLETNFLPFLDNLNGNADAVVPNEDPNITESLRLQKPTTR